jgi:hypothetical protein
MPRAGPRRPLVAIKLAQDGIDWIDQRAAEQGTNRSEMIRLMLAYAQRTMPKDWRPTR